MMLVKLIEKSDEQSKTMPRAITILQQTDVKQDFYGHFFAVFAVFVCLSL